MINVSLYVLRQRLADACRFVGGTLTLAMRTEEGHLEPLRSDQDKLVIELDLIGSGGSVPIALSPIPMIMFCPCCGERHIEGELADKPHRKHACQFCGMVWQPALVPTAGVKFLPGYKDEPKK